MRFAHDYLDNQEVKREKYLLSPISYLLSTTSYLLPPTSYLLSPPSYLLTILNFRVLAFRARM